MFVFEDILLVNDKGIQSVLKEIDNEVLSLALKTASEELKHLFRQRLAEFSKTLQDKERYIFEKRLISESPLTLQDIGDHYGVSRERARQIEAALINRMRDYMRQSMPDFELHLPDK